MVERKSRTEQYEINKVLYIVEAVESENAKETVYSKVRRLVLQDAETLKKCG